jgi:hypothetical protein
MRISAENMSTYFKTGHSDGNKHRKQNSADFFVIIADIDMRIHRLKALFGQRQRVQNEIDILIRALEKDRVILEILLGAGTC